MPKSQVVPAIVLLAVLAASPLVAQTASGAGQAIPDLSGIWEAPNELNDLYKNTGVCGDAGCASFLERPSAFKLVTTIEEPQMLPWAEERYKAARKGIENPAIPAHEEWDPWLTACEPASPAWMTLLPFVAVELRQFPDVVLLLHGASAGEADHSVRRVYMDGRGHPANFEPTWMGHSIGRYDGDTLVVDTVGMKGNRWLDSHGHPHSDQLHLVERIRLLDPNSLEFEVTITDPMAYKNSWGKKVVRKRAGPGPRFWDESNCEELLQMGTHFGAENRSERPQEQPAPAY